jgi:hypothetical protein
MSCSRQVYIAISVLASLTVVAGFAAAQGAFSKQDASRFREKVALIEGAEKRATAEQQRTLITEAELNAYFAFDGKDHVPAGVVDPRLALLGQGRVSGQAVVDLDAVRRQRSSGGWLDPLRYLTGRLPVSAAGVIRTREGVAWLELESAHVSGIPVPKQLLQELLTYYSRTPQNPQGLNLDDRIQLPARIREIELLQRGEAVIVQ